MLTRLPCSQAHGLGHPKSHMHKLPYAWRPEHMFTHETHKHRLTNTHACSQVFAHAWCSHSHVSSMPNTPFTYLHIFLNSHALHNTPAFICAYAHLLTHVYTHTHSCTLTMLTPFLHTHMYTHTEPTVYTFTLSCTHIYTLACSLVLEHTNHAKPSHDPAMGYFHLFPRHPLLPLTPSHFSGPVTLPS